MEHLKQKQQQKQTLLYLNLLLFFQQCKDFLRHHLMVEKEQAMRTGTESVLHVQDMFGRTPLHVSIAYQANVTATFLLLLGVDVFKCNNFGETALHGAASNG